MKKVIYLSAALAVLSGDTFCMNFDVAEKTVADAARKHSTVKVSAVQRNLMKNWLHSSKISAEDVESFFAGSGAFSGKTGNFDVLRAIAQGGQSRLATMKAKNISADEYRKLDEAGVFSDLKEGSVASRQVRSDLEASKKKQVQDLLGEKTDQFFGGAAAQGQPEQAKKFGPRDSELRRFAAREKIADIEGKLADPAQRAELCGLYSDIDSQIDKLAASVGDINGELSKLDGVDVTAFVGTSTKLINDLYSTKFEDAKTPVDTYLEQAGKIVNANDLVKLFVAGKPSGDQVLAFLDALDAFTKTPATGLNNLLPLSTVVTAAPDLSSAHFTVAGQDTAAGAVATTAAANEWYVAYAKSLQAGSPRKKQLLSADKALTVLWAIQAYNRGHGGQEFNAWDELLKVFPAELKAASGAQ